MRFNCQVPLCETTSLDVCSIDEHYEPGRPFVLATLIEPQDTATMGFSAFGAFDNSSRTHYTLAARKEADLPLNQLFSVAVAANGTAGALAATALVTFPDALPPADITYIFTAGGIVYVAFEQGTVVGVAPASGALVSNFTFLPAGRGLAATKAAGFDAAAGVFWSNAVGPDGFYLASLALAGGATTLVGPLPPTPGADTGPNKERLETSVATIPVYPPAAMGFGPAVRIMELRTSPEAPWIMIVTMDSATGNVTEVPMDADWWQDWDIDSEIVPQWPGSTHKVWSYDPTTNYLWIKLYDECGGRVDDCDENETILWLDWTQPGYVFWDIAVEPVEYQLTQMVWVPILGA